MHTTVCMCRPGTRQRRISSGKRATREAGRGTSHEASVAVASLPDEDLWAFRNAARAELVQYVRARLTRRCREHGGLPAVLTRCATVLDPQALTIGFARRFTSYKRPGLLLHDLRCLVAILNHSSKPVQLLIAGKAHPNDGAGRDMVREVARFCMMEDVWDRAIFLEDYDMAVAQALTGGVDIWLNNPARPLEACGTSGMKTLVNGGLNFSTLDGWWTKPSSPMSAGRWATAPTTMTARWPPMQMNSTGCSKKSSPSSTSATRPACRAAGCSACVLA